jgi:MFS family permease
VRDLTALEKSPSPPEGSRIASSPEPTTGEARIEPYAWYALLVLMLVYIVNFIDRQILSILTEDIKRDLHIGDTQIGFLYGTAFAIFYALFGIPLARLADGWRRTRLISIGLGVWSTMTALSGLANNYAQLAAARVGVGVGEASASPAAYSLIADYFPKERRGLALAIYGAGISIGSGIGLPLGGTVASRWNRAFAHGSAPFGLAGWQVAFLTVGLPGLLLAIWVATLREPLRGASDGEGTPIVRPGAWREFGRSLMAILPPLTLVNLARYPGGLRRNLILLAVVTTVATGLIVFTHDTLQWVICGFGVYAVGSWSQSLKETDHASWRLTFGTPAFVMMALVIGCVSIVDYGVGFWSTPYLLRTFYGHIDGPGHFFTALSAREEVSYFAAGSNVASALGIIFGGWLSDRWRRRHALGRIAVIALSITSYVTLRALVYGVNSLPLFAIGGPFISFVASFWFAPAIATFQELVLPRMRATAGALAVLSTTMVGQALGPYLVGKIATITGSLRQGIFTALLVTPLMLWALWQVWRRFALAEATRVERAGEAV